MRTLRLIAAGTCLTNITTMYLHMLAGDGLASAFTYGASAFSGWAYLYIKEAEQEMVTSRRELATQIRYDLNQKNLAPGTPLPNQRDLAEQYQASRTTVRAALALLAEEGLIDVVAGRGTFVAGSTGGTGRAWLVESHIRNKLAAGERVEPADSLAMSFSISPSTARRVLARMITDGVLRRRRDGTYEAGQ